MAEALTVLIVEDSEDDALLIVETLRRDSLAVTWERVQTAADLKPLLSTRRWDAIISDHSLPGFDAPTALAIVREQGLDLPFIVVSGVLGEQQAVALMKAGAQDYMMKDNLARLPEALRRELREAQNRRDRKQAELTVTRQRDLNHLMMAVTHRFVEVRAAQFDAEVTRTLGQIGAYLQADHGHVATLTANAQGTMRITHQWHHPDCTTGRQPPEAIPTAAFPWATAALLRQEVINVPQVGALSPDLSANCATDRTSWLGLDVGAVLCVPLIQKTRVVGYVGFFTQGCPTLWDDDTQQMVQVLAQTLASAQDRLQAERLLARREAQSWAMLSVMPDLLIRIGADGRYREVLSQNHPLDVVAPCHCRIGRHVSEILPAELAERKLQAIQQALATHEVQTYEQQILVGDRLQHEELRVVRCSDDEVLFLIRDISERKRGEAERKHTALALQQSEAHQRALVEALPDLLARLSKDGIYLEFVASPMFHVVGNLPELVGTHVNESLPPAAAQKRLDAIALALATQTIQFYEQDLSTAEKMQIEEVRVVPYRDDEVLALVRDISDQKAALRERDQAERQLQELNQSLERQVAERTAALEEREARYRGLMEGASDAILVADMEGHILEVNRRTEELFGRSRDQLTQMHQSQLHPPDHQAELIALFHESIDRHHFQALNVPILHADGRQIPVDITATTIDLGTNRVVQGIFRDVSDRQRIEAENQRLRDRLGFLLDSSPAVIYSVEPTGSYRPTFISQNLADILGYESEAFIANFTDWREYYHPEEATSLWAGISTVVERGFYAMEYRFRHRDGHYLWVQDEARVAYDTCGQPQEIIGYLADITDRKCAEERLRQTNAELLRATRLKDEFLANMSHELRTPLNAILGMTEGLQEQVFGAINDRQLKALTTVETSASHLLALINDILDVAKIESGQITLHLTPTAIAPLCQSSLTFVQQQAYKKRIQLLDCIFPNLPDLVIDERRVRQILINLLTNAVKFTPEGGRVSLTVTPEVRQIGDETQSMVRFTIRDTGIGIAPDDQHKLFQPFIQIDSALNRQYQGTGLGLTLVKQITELHGGQVGLTSEVGVGSRFTIDLPYNLGSGLQPADLSTALIDLPPAAALPQPLPLILLAGDQEATISTVVNYLTAKGYRLLVGRQGAAARALAQAENPDLIVIDMPLPEGDGLETIRRIRDDPHLADRPIIALADASAVGDCDRCLAAGANQHLGKPLKLKQLAAAIQHLLNPVAPSTH